MHLHFEIFVSLAPLKCRIGCFWGTEKFFKADFGVKNFPGSGRVVSGSVGFMGPQTAKINPTYKEVSFQRELCSHFCFVGFAYSLYRYSILFVFDFLSGLFWQHTARGGI